MSENVNDNGGPKPDFGRRPRMPTSPVLDVSIALDRLEEAKRRDSRHCWVAEGIKEQYPQFTDVLVDTATIRLSNPDRGLRYIYLTPQIVRNAIYRFDHGESVEAFSFRIRGAHIRPMRTKDGAKSRISLADWEQLKGKIQKISSEQRTKLKTIADEMEIPRNTLYGRLHDGQIPTAAVVTKMEKWLFRRTGEKPAPRRKLQSDLVAGPTRVKINPRRPEQPEIIGGREPAKAMHLATRQFGLRQLNWKIPGTETTLQPPPLRPGE